MNQLPKSPDEWREFYKGLGLDGKVEPYDIHIQLKPRASTSILNTNTRKMVSEVQGTAIYNIFNLAVAPMRDRIGNLKLTQRSRMYLLKTVVEERFKLDEHFRNIIIEFG